MASRSWKNLPALLAVFGAALMVIPPSAEAAAATVGEPLLGPSHVTASEGQKAVKPEDAKGPLPVGQPLDLSNVDVSFGPSLASQPFEFIPVIGGGGESFGSRLAFALRPLVTKNGQVLLAVPMRGTAISLSIGAGSIFVGR
jgi:hypothetical protein